MTENNKTRHSNQHHDASSWTIELSAHAGSGHPADKMTITLRRTGAEGRTHSDQEPPMWVRRRLAAPAAGRPLSTGGTLMIDALLDEAVLRDLNRWRARHGRRAAMGWPLTRAGLVSPRLRSAMIEALHLDTLLPDGSPRQTSSGASAQVVNESHRLAYGNKDHAASENPIAEAPHHDSGEEPSPPDDQR